MTTTFCLINVSGRSTYSSVHCRWKSVSCCSRSSVEQSSTARHCCPLSPSSAVVLNHISSHFLVPLSDSSITFTVLTQWLVILDIIIIITCNIYHILSFTCPAGLTQWFHTDSEHRRLRHSTAAILRLQLQGECVPLLIIQRLRVTHITWQSQPQVIVCNAVIQLTISCWIPEMFAIMSHCCLKLLRKSDVLGCHFLTGRAPKFLISINKSRPSWNLVWWRLAKWPSRLGGEKRLLTENKHQQQNITLGCFILCLCFLSSLFSALVANKGVIRVL